MSAAPCPTCGLDDEDKIFCPAGHVTVTKLRGRPETMRMKAFWESGDPSVFDTPSNK